MYDHFAELEIIPVNSDLDLWQQIMINVLRERRIDVRFPDLGATVKEIIEGECYKALKEIKEIIDDPYMEDRQCFGKIERIICQFESMGSDGGCRHDF